MTTLSNRYACTIAFAICAFLAPLSSNAHETGDTAPSTTIGTEIDDAVITTKVRAALISDEDIKSLDIKVKTYKGEVMLSGFANNQAQIDRSVAVAADVEGVKKVDNKLSLKEGKQTLGNKIDDGLITTRVKSELLSDPVMKSLEVSVTTRKGEVQLSGFVDNEVQLTHAENVAWGVEGVENVINNLSIKK